MELHDKHRKVLAALKEGNPDVDPEEYEGTFLKALGGMNSVNQDKDNPESVSKLQELYAKASPQREAEIIIKAEELGYSGILDRGIKCR